MRRPSAETVVLLLLLSAFMGLAVVREREASQAERHRGPTAFSTAPDGTRALYDLCRLRGKTALRFTKPIGRLPGPGQVGLAVICEPLRQPMSAEDARYLRQWVANGGVLLLVVSPDLGPAAGQLMDGVTVVGSFGKAHHVSVSSEHPLLRDVKSLYVERGGYLTSAAPRAVSLVTDGGRPLAIELRKGNGTVLIVSGAMAPTNRTLGRADNAVFYMNVIEDATKSNRTLAFLETYHLPWSPTSERRSIWNALPAPVRGAVWLIALLVAGAIWNGNHRFGGRRSGLQSAAGGGSGETAGALYVRSMASLLRRAHCPELAVEYIHETLEHDLAREAGVACGPGEHNPRTAGRLPDDLRGKVAEVLAFGASISRGGKTTEEKLVFYARQVQTVRRSLGLD